MKRKLQKLSTKQLKNLFNEEFATTYLSNEILDLLSDAKARKFIIDKFISEFTNNEEYYLGTKIEQIVLGF